MPSLKGGAKVGKPGLQGDGEDVLILVGGEVDAIVPLAELGAIVVHEEAEM